MIPDYGGDLRRVPAAVVRVVECPGQLEADNRLWPSKLHAKAEQDLKKSLTSWWFQPICKIWVKMGIFPKQGENKKSLKPPPSWEFDQGPPSQAAGGAAANKILKGYSHVMKPIHCPSWHTKVGCFP